MLTVQKTQALLTALTREVMNEKALIDRLGVSRDEAAALGHDEQVSWCEKQIVRHKVILGRAQKSLADTAALAGVESPEGQKRGPGRPRKDQA